MVPTTFSSKIAAAAGLAPSRASSPQPPRYKARVASRGGIPLIEGGKLIGAIGCSGGTCSQDEATCKAATDNVK